MDRSYISEHHASIVKVMFASMEINLPGAIIVDDEDAVNQYLKNFRETHRNIISIRASTNISESESDGDFIDSLDDITRGVGPSEVGTTDMAVVDIENSDEIHSTAVPSVVLSGLKPVVGFTGSTLGQRSSSPSFHSKSIQRASLWAAAVRRKLSRWSIFYLTKQFCNASIEELYQRYRLRLQRRLLLRLLVSLTCYHVVMLILNLTVGSQVTMARFRVNAFIAVTGLLPALLAILVFIRRVYYFGYSALVISVIVIAYLNAFTITYLSTVHRAFDKPISPSVNVPLVVYFMFVIHTMMPFSRKLSTFFALLTALVDLTVTGVLSSVDHETFVEEMCANVVIYISAALTGLYHKHLTDIANRHTFLDTRRFIEADMKYGRHREKQNLMKEGLLLKIIPKHHLEDMKKLLNRKLVEVIQSESDPRQRMFHDFIVERHDNVSILYADIVNFTPLTSTLEPSELVFALNQLFGSFDELCKANECMRIRMLGDCYYCVCGLPNSIPKHARNCIIMGMQMIKVIRAIRMETGVDKLDMRIGVHTGYVLSGILGLRKWQYDVWSDDVTIANHMESSGLPGKVHITQRTKAELHDEFQVEPAAACHRDEYLKLNNIQTFFIVENEYLTVSIDELIPRDTTTVTASPEQLGRRVPRRASLSRRRFSSFIQSMNAEQPFDGLREYHQALTTGPEAAEVNRRLERAFYLERDSAENDKKDRVHGHMREIQTISLRFNNPRLEQEYANMKDSFFKFYIVWAFVLYVLLVFVQLILLDRTLNLLLGMCIGLVLFSSLLFVTTGLRCQPRDYNTLISCVQTKVNTVSDLFISHVVSKICLCFLSVAIIFAGSAIPVINCSHIEYRHDSAGSMNETNNITNCSDADYNSSTTVSSVPFVPCLFAPYYTYSCMVTLIACSIFIRVSHIAKMTLMLICVAVFNVMFYNVFNDVFGFYDDFFNVHYLSSTIRGTMHTAMLFSTLLMLDRQLEKNLRLDFLCKHEMEADLEEVKRNDLVNELLLVNILPKHVAEHFIMQSPSKTTMYHIICPNAAIMFAAIPNFKAFFSEVDVTGKECLRLLNEIISSFDKLLMNNRFQGVEKMKTIGSTYMAAAGLEPAEDLVQDEQQPTDNLLLIIRFAFSMIRKLSELSKDAFYEYKLRIGINQGKVIAGVVGASKPQFDIWGDAVNVASRMESQGVIDRIQVTEETAMILQSRGLQCDHRGRIEVKGKGQMPVYLISDIYRRNVSINSTDSKY